jgi:hypothetical protein
VTKYTNLEQRMAHTYMDMFPPFIPLPDGEVSTQSQEQFYLFMKNVYQTLFASPELFFKTIHEDDAYPNRFNRASYGKPKLNNYMKRDLKEIDELLSCLFSLGKDGAVADNRLIVSEAVETKKKHRGILPHFGLRLDGNVLSCDGYDGLFDAWRWMATRENAAVISFSRCMFDPECSYIQTAYSTLFGNEKAFGRLVQYLQKSSYTRFDLKRGVYTLDYVKWNTEKDVPLGFPIHGDPHHYGISAEYAPYAVIPQFLVLRILDMKNMLLKFDLMSEDLKGFVIRHVKKCDRCGYCTQTDKSGKRKPLYIQISHNGDYEICPLYPGFNFAFTKLDEELAMNLTAFLDFMDKHLSGER